MSIRAAFLDVDGTTVDSEPRNRKAIEEVSRIGGYIIQPSDWNFLAGQGDDKIWAKINDMQPDLSLVFNTAASYERACLNAKLHLIEHVKKVEETAAAILLFRENAIEIATVSNGPAIEINASLKQSGYKAEDFLFQLFKDDILAAGLRTKPHPDPYVRALEMANERRAPGTALIKPSECLVLEDSGTGTRAGLAAGMNVIQMTNESPAIPKEEALELTLRHGGTYHPVRRHDLLAACRKLM